MGGAEAMLAAPAASAQISDARRPSYEIIAPSDTAARTLRPDIFYTINTRDFVNI